MSVSPSSTDCSPEDWSFLFHSFDEPSACAFADDLAQIIRTGDCIALDGDLGLGKSTLARALLRARAQDAYLEVPSPTFTLVQGYDFGDLEISHFDLYRISEFEELYEIGLEESWQDGAALVEWPDRAEELLPPNCLWLRFEPGDHDHARRLTLIGSKEWGDRLQRICEKRQLLVKAGWGDAIIRPIEGDLSPRQYDRVKRPERVGEDFPSAILMDMPEREAGPTLDDGRVYDHIAHRITALPPMVSILEGLRTLGVHLPDVYGFQLDQGLMLWEDFGGVTLADSSHQPVPERYLATVSSLAKLHAQPLPERFAGSGGDHCLSLYDEAAFAIELEVFLDHFWPHVKGSPCPSEEKSLFFKLWEPHLTHLASTSRALVLRDVQNPNCFWLGKDDPDGPVGFIDFQDCLIGPAAYDLAALAMDARVTISDALEAEMLNHYKDVRNFNEDIESQFNYEYAMCAAQRTSKNLGAFARAANQFGKPDYLDHIPRGLSYLQKALTHPLLSDLKDWYISRDLLAD